MTCPICDQKAANCDCTPAERQQYNTIVDLEDRIQELEQALEQAWGERDEWEAKAKSFAAEAGHDNPDYI